jgi:predicted helicase
LERGVEIAFDVRNIRDAIYRPFTKLKLYAKNPVVDREGTLEFFPTKSSSDNNRVIYSSNHSQIPFTVLAGNSICDAGLAGRAGQCFPRFSYSKNGQEQRDNITSKASALFKMFYADEKIGPADIFHYVYAVLHHPIYRTRFADNLKRELPRIPFIGLAASAGGNGSAAFFPFAAVEAMQAGAEPRHHLGSSGKLFHTFAEAGEKLANLHINYESAREYPLERRENRDVKLDWRVERMKLSKDKGALFYNDFLMLDGIPTEVFDYRLGNRSALEWVIDQYQVNRDEKGDITSDPNRMDDEQYIVRLIGQVISVSVETLKIVEKLPPVESAQNLK